MEMVASNSIVSLGDEVLSRTVKGEDLILSLNKGEYFGLEEVGSLIWQKVRETCSIEEIVTAVVDEFDVQRPKAEEDTLSLLKALQAEGLVKIATP